MDLTFEQTKVLIEAVLNAETMLARKVLRDQLEDLGCKEPSFYISVLKHSQGISLAEDQWFDFLSKITTHVLRDDRQIMNKLSTSRQVRLPPATLG
jgi:hypothetical protein